MQVMMSEKDEDKNQRLHVYIAHCGVCSRRTAERLITDGRVTVNGQTFAVLGSKVSAGDAVAVDGVPLAEESALRYLLLNKPAGFICSASDPQGRRLASELLPSTLKERLYNVGRLDFQSSGAIIYTNDGGFAARVGHPSSCIEKEYLIRASRVIADEVFEEFCRGVSVEGKVYRAERIERVGDDAAMIVLIEGNNREIRRVFSFFHLHLLELRRVRIGTVELGNLPEGQCRTLSAAEIISLMKGGNNGYSH